MKAKLPDDTIVIPSNFPRTRGGPDSRGVRICFQEIGRSCELNQGYMIFMDGSAYVYSAPSREALEQLCDSLIRGKLFNFAVRRAVFGFTRGFTPPADYEVIYEYPPYEGSKPGICISCTGHNVNIGDTTWNPSSLHASLTIVGTGDDITLDATSDFPDFGIVGATAHDLCFPEAYDVTATVNVGSDGNACAVTVWVGGVVFWNQVGFGPSSSDTKTLTVPKFGGATFINAINLDGTYSIQLQLSPATPP